MPVGEFTLKLKFSGITYYPPTDEELRQLAGFIRDIIECNTLLHVREMKINSDFYRETWKLESAP
jgi:hypothetical protein